MRMNDAGRQRRGVVVVVVVIRACRFTSGVPIYKTSSKQSNVRMMLSLLLRGFPALFMRIRHDSNLDANLQDRFLYPRTVYPVAMLTDNTLDAEKAYKFYRA